MAKIKHPKLTCTGGWRQILYPRLDETKPAFLQAKRIWTNSPSCSLTVPLWILNQLSQLTATPNLTGLSSRSWFHSFSHPRSPSLPHQQHRLRKINSGIHLTGSRSHRSAQGTQTKTLSSRPLLGAFLPIHANSSRTPSLHRGFTNPHSNQNRYLVRISNATKHLQGHDSTRKTYFS